MSIPILIAVLLLASLSIAAPVPSYFPLAVGATWTRRGDDGAQVAVRVVGPKVVGSVRCAVVETKSSRPVAERITRNCYLASEHQVLVIETEGARGPVVLVPPRPLMLLPPAAGKKWAWRPKNSPNITVTDQWVLEEEVRVPAGRFRAWKLHSVAKQRDVTFTIDTWYAPGVGIVKIEREAERGGEEREGKSQLVSYKIP